MKNLKAVMTSRHFGRMPKTKTLKMYFTRVAKNEITNEIGDSALYILEYWLEATGTPANYIVDDKRTANALGRPVRVVQRCRLALQKANLFRTLKAPPSSGIQQITYCFGKEGVYTAFYFPDIFGYGINSIAGAIKHYKAKGVKEILDSASIKPFERKDIYQLFNHKYHGEFVQEEAA